MRIAALIIALSAITSTANAAPPMTEFYLTKYDGKDCLARAATALTDTGFKPSGGTFTNEDRVGVKGEYKGAVGCSSELPNAVVFVVSGPAYKEASALARKLQEKFLGTTAAAQ